MAGARAASRKHARPKPATRDACIDGRRRGHHPAGKIDDPPSQDYADDSR